MAFRKKTVLFVTGTRAEWGLMRSTVKRLQASKALQLRIVATGMHTQHQFGYTLDEIKKTVHVDHVATIKEHDDQLTALSKEIEGIGAYLAKHPVDAVLVVGDRDEPFAAATASVHLDIPVIHIAGGDHTGPTVDEYLRNAITQFASLHLTQTVQSAKNVKAMGADPRRVVAVGAPGLDGIRKGALLAKSVLGKRLHLDQNRPWFLTVMHPTKLEPVSIKQQIQSVTAALRKLNPDAEKIVLYPNSDDGCDVFIKEIKKIGSLPHVHIVQHLPREEYLSLMKHSAAFIGNSSSGLMEAGFLKTPFVHVGNRQQHREHGPNVHFVPYKAAAIVAGVQKVLSPAFQAKIARGKSPYKGGAVSQRIVRAIEQFLQSAYHA